jgi:ArsR family transcriptional regulator
METVQAVNALAALAHQTRLSIFRLLVEAGPDGLAAGVIGETLKIPAATLSFHLANLAHAGLVQNRQEGRFVIYSTDFANMNALVGYLTENCCARTGCRPSARPPTRGRPARRRQRATAKA